jgi:hypothetical protein
MIYALLARMVDGSMLWVSAILIFGMFLGARHFAVAQGLPLLFGVRDIVTLSLAALVLTVMMFRVLDDSRLASDLTPDLWTIAFLCAFVATVTFSVTESSGGRPQVIASIAAKFALMFLLPVVIVPTVALALSATRDRRFRDGTKGNSATAIMGLGGMLLSWLVVSLMQPRSR